VTLRTTCRERESARAREFILTYWERFSITPYSSAVEFLAMLSYIFRLDLNRAGLPGRRPVKQSEGMVIARLRKEVSRHVPPYKVVTSQHSSPRPCSPSKCYQCYQCLLLVLCPAARTLCALPRAQGFKLNLPSPPLAPPSLFLLGLIPCLLLLLLL